VQVFGYPEDPRPPGNKLKGAGRSVVYFRALKSLKNPGFGAKPQLNNIYI